MEWAEVDRDRALWTNPAAKMKRTMHGKVNGRPHLVLLAKRAVAVLRELHQLSGHGSLCIPQPAGRRALHEREHVAYRGRLWTEVW